MDPERRSAYSAGVLAGLLVGVLTLLLAAVVRLYGGPASPPERLFDAIVASTPGRLESWVIARLRHAAKPLLLSTSTGAILVTCAAAGAAIQALDAAARAGRRSGASPSLPLSHLSSAVRRPGSRRHATASCWPT